MVHGKRQEPVKRWRAEIQPDGRVAAVQDGWLMPVPALIVAGKGQRWLGVNLDKDLTLKAHRDEVVDRTVKGMRRVGALTHSHGGMDARAQRHAIFHVWSKISYACEVWTSCEWGYRRKLRQALSQACARALHVPTSARQLFTMGEMGVRGPTAELYRQVVAWYCELLVMPQDEACAWAYAVSREAYEDGAARQQDSCLYGWRRPPPVHNWCSMAHAVLRDIGKPEAWSEGRAWLAPKLRLLTGKDLPAAGEMRGVAHMWRRLARDLGMSIVDKWAADTWRQDVLATPQLGLFARLHPRLEFARYLDEAPNDDRATHLRTRLRAGLYPLAQVMAHRGPEAEMGDGFCILCGQGVEDGEHFVMRCPALAPARGNLWARLRGACRSDAMKAHLDGHDAAVRDRVVLCLVLGGDLCDLDGCTDMMISWNRARRLEQQLPPGVGHPAGDRVRALRTSGHVLTLMERLRRKLLARAGVPAGWLGRPEYAAPERPGGRGQRDRRPPG